MSKETIEYLPLDSIASASQIRKHFDENEITGLAMSLRAIEQQIPIRVRRDGDRYVIVDGERRVRAAKKAGIPTISAIVEGKELSDGEVLHRQISINAQRLDVEPSAKANAVRRLMECKGWNATEAAKQLGMSSASVTRLLAMPSLAEAVRELVDQGKLAVSTAYEISRVGDPAKQLELATEAVNGQLTRDAAHAKAKRCSRSRKGAKRRRTRKITAMIGSSRISMSGSELSSLEAIVALVEEFLSKAKAAQSEGIGLDDFLKTLKATSAA